MARVWKKEDDVYNAISLNQKQQSINVRNFGAFGDSNIGGTVGHDDTAAIQSVFTAVVALGITGGGATIPSIYFPPGYYHITGPITISPPGNAFGNFVVPRIYGEGMWHQSTIVCDGATAGFVFANNGATYQRWSSISELSFEGINGATNGVVFNFTAVILVQRLLIHGFAQEGLLISNSNSPTVTCCYIYGCGSATHSQVRFNLCTVVKFTQNDVDASASAQGGISVERCSMAAIQNNVIESCGTLIIVSGETESTVACGIVTISDNDLENPLVGYEATPVHISIGNGLSTVFCRTVRVTGNNGAGNLANVSGAFGCHVAQCQQFEAVGNIFSLSSNAGCQYNFGAAASVESAIVRAQREEVGYTFAWVKVNGAQVLEATPYADWYSLQATSGLQFPKLVTTNPTATINNQLGTQGGLYQIIHIGNAGGGLTVNFTAQVPLNSGYPMMLMPTDANITLGHNAGVKGFFLKGLANLALTLTNPVLFVYNSTTGKWHQL